MSLLFQVFKVSLLLRISIYKPEHNFIDCKPESSLFTKLEEIGSIKADHRSKKIIKVTYSWTPYSLHIADMMLLRHSNCNSGNMRPVPAFCVVELSKNKRILLVFQRLRRSN